MKNQKYPCGSIGLCIHPDCAFECKDDDRLSVHDLEAGCWYQTEFNNKIFHFQYQGTYKATSISNTPCVVCLTIDGKKAAIFETMLFEDIIRNDESILFQKLPTP